VKRGLIVASALLVAACGPGVDYGRCLEHRTQTSIIMQTVVCGSSCVTMVPMMLPTTTCVRWEFPEGRPHEDVHVQAPAP
jgi:hypothetical protein